MGDEVKDTVTPPAAATPAPEVKTPPEGAPPPAEKPPEAKPLEEKKPTPETPPPEKKVAPEKYDLKLPEGSPLDAKDTEKIAAHAKAQGLSQVEAQALIERESTRVAESVVEQAKAWATEAQADSEIGGEAFLKNVETAKQVVQHFSPELSREFDRNGSWNHPGLLRLLTRVGKGMSPDKLVPAGAPVVGEKSIAELFYGKTGE